MFERKLKLPTTLDEFDHLVLKVVDKFKLDDPHHAAAIISVAIRHLPPTDAYTTLEYLGHYVIKNLANYVANHRGQTLQHESQIDQLIQILDANPHDMEAFDKIQASANEGSEYAKLALAKFEAATQTAVLPN